MYLHKEKKAENVTYLGKRCYGYFISWRLDENIFFSGSLGLQNVHNAARARDVQIGLISLRRSGKVTVNIDLTFSFMV